MKRILATVLVFCVFTLNGAFSFDLELSAYKPLGALSGKLKSIGSDTLLHEMELWAEGFKAIYPGVEIEIEGKGSNMAPPALLSGELQLAPMSRQMTPDEFAGFEPKFGYKPTGVLVAVDALAIYVHKDNPISCLTMEQLERVFAADPKMEAARASIAGANWAWPVNGRSGRSRSIAATPCRARTNISGRMLLAAATSSQRRIWSRARRLLSGRSRTTVSAIGYSGIGYRTEGVRAVPIAAGDGKKCFDTSFESAYTRKYPLARGLYVYLLKNPKSPLDTLSGEFVKYILSRDGQTQAKRGGYYPITRNIRDTN